MKILITGANGQLGRSLQRVMTMHEIVALSHEDLDVTDSATFQNRVSFERPQVLIHAAALTDTNACEQDPTRASRVNGAAAEYAAIASVGYARLVYISTNEVFDGDLGRSYREDDLPNPINTYASSKRDGEKWAYSVHSDTLIVRASWLYGAGYLNFNEKVLAAAREGRPLSFVTDEVATPTSTDDLAAAIAALLAFEAAPGIYHLSNEGEASRYDWALEILRLSGLADTPVEAVTTAELRAKGYTGPQKPPYSVLANTRAAALGIRMRDWREALAEYFGARVP